MRLGLYFLSQLFVKLVSIVGGNPLRHPVLSHLFVNLASDVGGNPLRRPVTSYLSVYLASDVGGNPLRHPVQSHQKLVRTCRHTILTSSYVLENISLPCLLSMNGEKFRILFRALVSVYSPVCYLVERSVRGLKVQSRILGFFSLVRTVSRRYL